MQKVKQSTERQRELENEQARALDLLNSTGSGNGYIETDVPSLQSKLRELEKKIELETVHYEELMLELTLSKRHDKASRQSDSCGLFSVLLYTITLSLSSPQFLFYLLLHENNSWVLTSPKTGWIC